MTTATNGANGKHNQAPTSPADARARRKQLKEAAENVQLLETKLRALYLESRMGQAKRVKEQAEWWNIVDGASEVFDRLRSQDRENLYPLSNANDRRYGANWPFWRHLIEHSRIRATSRLLCGTNQLARGALGGLTSFVIGQGYTYRAVAKKNTDPPEDLVAVVQEVVDEFMEVNEWPAWEQEVFKRTRRDGEAFTRHFPVDDGITVIGTVEPEWVLEPPQHDAELTSFGCFNEKDNLLKITSYWVAPDGITANGEEVESGELDHIKINVDRIIKRGLADFAYDSYETFKRVGRLLENLTEGAAIQSAIAFIRQHKTADPAAVDAFLTGQAHYQRANVVTGGNEKVHRYQAGEIVDIDAGQEYVVPPFANNNPGWVEIVQAGLRSAAVLWNAPEWLVSSDASNGNFASSLVAEAPFSRWCKRQQESYRVRFMRTIARVIRHACVSGRIVSGGRTWRYEEVKRLVEIIAGPPTVEVRNKQAEAQTAAVEIQAGMNSRQNYAQQQGYDWDRIEADNEEWEEKHGGAGQQLPMPGDDDGGGGGGDDPRDADAAAYGGLDLGGFEGDNPFESGVPAGVGTALLEAGFSGTITTKDGRKLTYQNGKPVKATQTKTGGEKAAAGQGATGKGTSSAAASAGRAAAVKQAIAGLKEKGVKVKAAADRIGAAAWSKLPPRGQKIAQVSFTVGHYVMHKAETAMRAGKALAVEVAKQRGFSEAHVERTARILGVADTIAAWTVNMPATLAVTGSVGAAKVSSFLPVASMAYIAFSAVANPFATARAAKAAITGKLKTKGHESIVEASQEDLAAELLQRLEGMDDAQADWYTALVCAALDETEDLAQALELADAAMEQTPAVEEQRTEPEGLIAVPDIRQHDHYSCILPGQELQGRVIGGSKARYSGQAIELRTASGATLTVTANHPVMTSEGFVAAGKLKKGDCLLRYVGESQASGASDDIQHAPAKVEQVFRSLLHITGEVSAAQKVAASAFDFHGDGAFFDGKIEVVGSYRKLRGDVVADAAKRLRQTELVRSSFDKVGLTRRGVLHPGIKRSHAATAGVVRGSQLLLPVHRRKPAPDFATSFGQGGTHFWPAHRQEARFGPAANLNVSLAECAGDGTAPDAALAAKLLDRRSSEVAPDEIIDARSFHYDGPVYDFESPLGYVVVNQLLISNCGAAAAMCVGRYFGVGPETLDEWKEQLGTNVQQSTSPVEIVGFLRSLGLQAEPYQGMTLDDLRTACEAGSPVICCVQDYGPQVPDKAKFEYGHYLTVIGLGFGMVFCQDSSQDNVTDGSGTVSAPGRVMIPEKAWLENWRDRDVEGKEYNRFGIVVSKGA